MAEINKRDLNEVKVGARILSREILDKFLPTWNNIEEQIRGFRKRAYKINQYNKLNFNKLSSNNIDHDRDYDNIISILGERGTGKTSVLLTIKNEIEYKEGREKTYKDIILPLIVPDDMSKISDALGWIILNFNDEVDRLSKILRGIDYEYDDQCKYLKKGFEKCILNTNEDSKLRHRYTELKKAYSIRKKEYFEIITNQYIGKNEYISDNDEVINADRNIIIKFKAFIDELINSKRIENNQRNKEDEPLIFIFFDDVDISTDKCYEVLDTILKFLTHQNIVVFVSGDYKVFSETMTIEFLRKDGLLDDKLLDRNFTESKGQYTLEEGIITIQNTLERKKRYTQDFLKKVLPPTFRYKMPTLNNEQKIKFCYKSEHDNLGSLINDVFGEILPNYYFSIFDNTPRGLINVYYSLWEYKNLDSEFKNNHKINIISQLISVIVNSSKVLVGYENVIKNYIVFNDNFININYNNLESECDNSLLSQKRLDEKLQTVNEFINLYLLGKFTEKISRGIEVNITMTNGYEGNISVFINKLNPHLVPELNQEYEELIVKFYFKIIENINMNEIEKLFKNDKDNTNKKKTERYYEPATGRLNKIISV